MPVYECECGLVTSIPTSETYRRCIRCGRAKAAYLWQLDTPRPLRAGFDPSRHQARPRGSSNLLFKTERKFP
jgi:hypothetical protein